MLREFWHTLRLKSRNLKIGKYFIKSFHEIFTRKQKSLLSTEYSFPTQNCSIGLYVFHRLNNLSFQRNSGIIHSKTRRICQV